MIIYRPPTMDDLPAVVQLSNDYTMHWAGRFLEDEGDFREKWARPHIQLERNTRLALDGERVVGYIEIYPRRRFLINILDCYIHPDYMKRGIDEILYDWAEGQTALWLANAPPEAQVIIRAGIIWRDEIAQALLRRRGYTPVRHFHEMEIHFEKPPPSPRWPQDVVVRPFQMEEAFRLAKAHQESFSDHWGAVPMSAEDFYATWKERLDSPHFSPENWFVAWDGDEIAGFSLCRSSIPQDPNMAWVDVLGVRQAWRGRGLGLALLLHSFGVFYERGKTRMGLSVDSANPTGATNLYLKAGMQPTLRFDAYDKIIRAGEDWTNRAEGPGS